MSRIDKLRGEIARDFKQAILRSAAEVVASRSHSGALLDTISEFEDRVSRDDPQGSDALYDESVSAYHAIRECRAFYDHWWHDLGSELVPIPDHVEGLFSPGFLNEWGYDS